MTKTPLSKIMKAISVANCPSTIKIDTAQGWRVELSCVSKTIFICFICATMYLSIMANIVSGATITSEVKQFHGKEGFIYFNGDIDKNTDVDLIKVYKSLNDGKPEGLVIIYLNLNSNGGDLDAAMRAGEFVRQKKIWTAAEGSCASSAVLLLLGGVNRFCAGKIGLHRAYYEKYSNSESESKTDFEKINQEIKKYLKRMNIPEALLDEMNAVPPGEIKWLDGKDDADKLKLLQIIGMDPVYADQKQSDYAKRLGISKTELYLRQQRANAEKANFDLTDEASSKAYEKMYDDIMNGKR